MGGQLASADYLRTADQICLAAKLSMDEALRNLGTFAFVAVHLFSVIRRQVTVIAELLCLIERLEEIHTEV